MLKLRHKIYLNESFHDIKTLEYLLRLFKIKDYEDKAKEFISQFDDLEYFINTKFILIDGNERDYTLALNVYQLYIIEDLKQQYVIIPE